MKSLFTMLAMSTALFLSTLAFAGDYTPAQFFTTLEGKWTGSGQVTFMSQGAEPRRYDVTVDQTGTQVEPGIWRFTLNVKGTPQPTSTTTSYELQDSTFNVISSTYRDRADLLEINEKSMEFRSAHAEIGTGQVIDVVRTLHWKEAGVLSFQNRIIQDGVVIQQSNYILQKVGLSQP
jgi:hypothetical protein